LLGLLAECVGQIGRLAARAGPTPPEEVRAGVAELLSLLGAAADGGDGWLAAADGSELAHQELRRRVRQAYRLPPDYSS
jgi:hypothetical protein